MLLASWFLLYFSKRFRSLNAENLRSVGQRASKLPAVRFGGLKKKSAAWPWPLSNQSAQIQSRASSNHFQSLTASNFKALWPTDLKFSAFKDLFPFSIVSKAQEAGSILRVNFALSKWHHLHRAFSLTVPFDLILSVYEKWSQEEYRPTNVWSQSCWIENYRKYMKSLWKKAFFLQNHHFFLCLHTFAQSLWRESASQVIVY